MIKADATINGSTAERAHRHSISIHCPNCDEMEMAARVELAMLRDTATVGSRVASDSASTILGEIVRLATGAVFAPLPTSQLLRLKAALTITMMAAREVERVTRG